MYALYNMFIGSQILTSFSEAAVCLIVIIIKTTYLINTNLKIASYFTHRIYTYVLVYEVIEASSRARLVMHSK